jgi:hypothetical protein
MVEKELKQTESGKHGRWEILPGDRTIRPFLHISQIANDAKFLVLYFISILSGSSIKIKIHFTRKKVGVLAQYLHYVNDYPLQSRMMGQFIETNITGSTPHSSYRATALTSSRSQKWKVYLNLCCRLKSIPIGKLFQPTI